MDKTEDDARQIGCSPGLIWLPWLEAVLSAALEAGQRIEAVSKQRREDGELDVAQKSDASPVTQADLQANEVLTNRLGELTPDIAVVSEENEASHQHRTSGERFWLVDPLDGTREFVSGYPEYTVNVALIEAGRSIFGVVLAPALDELYWGGLAYGAFQRTADGDQAIRCSEIPAADAKGGYERTLRIMASRQHLNAATSRWIEAHQSHELVRIGSSLKFCHIAAGRADCYPRLSPTCEWDTAAAQAIVEAAGGSVVDARGRALQYGKAEVLNPSFLVLGQRSSRSARIVL